MSRKKKIITSTVVLLAAVLIIIVLLLFWYFFGYSYNVLPPLGEAVESAGNSAKLLGG